MDRIGTAMGESGMTPLLPYTPIRNRPYRSDDEATTDGRGKMPTFGSWFSGFGGVDCGAKAAGLELVFACEYDPEIAAVYKLNFGDRVTIGNILMFDNGISHPDYPRTKNAEKRRRQDIIGDWWTRVVARGANPKDFEFSTPRFPHVNFKHDSPPCPEFSNAKAGGREGLRDIALARKCCEYLMYAWPDKYTLENVYGYRKSESWRTIAGTLHGLGYSFNFWHVNMASYGVPQTRKRMIVIARRDGIKPMLPPATHAEKPEVGLFGTLKPWVGWYEAIKDLIPGLPESKFAKWQLERLPAELKETLFLQAANSQSNGKIYNEKDEPARMVDTTGFPKALIVVDGRNSNQEWGKLYREGEEPATAVTALNRPAHFPRAYIAPIQGEATNGFYENEPAQTIAANRGAGKYRAFIMEGTGAGDFGTPISDQDEPVFVVKAAAHKGMPRAFIVMSNATSLERASVGGRIVQMTPRALARFQSFPDSYILPDSKKLACTGLGNAEPPLFAQRKYESLL